MTITGFPVVNTRLDEVLKKSLPRTEFPRFWRTFRPKQIQIDMVHSSSIPPLQTNYSTKQEKCYIFVLVDDQERYRFMYEGETPGPFLRTQRLLLSEMFACNIVTYLNWNEVQ